jgi:hypothetical protein
LCIFKFHAPSGTQMELGFFWRNNFPLEGIWGEEAHEWVNKDQTSLGGAGPSSSCTTSAHLAVVALKSSILISDWRGWPKKPYIKTPRGVLVRRQRRNTKPWNRGCTYEDWRGKCCRSRPRSLLQPLQHHQHRQHNEERVVHLCTMGLWQ